jgi:dihydroflavonol-4-reductase
MKILVTGASGFLGTHLTKELVGRGYVVRGMVRDLRKANYLSNSGLEYTIVRPSGMYGPRNLDDVAYWFITTLAKGGVLSKFMIEGGEYLVQFAHVKDVVQGFTLVLEKPEVSVSQTYIVSDEEAYTYREVYEILSHLLSKEPPKIKLDPRVAKFLLTFTEIYDRLRGGENLILRRSIVDAVTTHRAYSISKAKKELGYRPQYDLRKGLEETIEWYRNNGFL